MQLQLQLLLLSLGLSIANGLLEYKITKATSKLQLTSAIELRFPLVTAPELSSLFELYLPRYQQKEGSVDRIDTFVATNIESRSIVGAIHIQPRTLVIHDLTVDERFRRLGIASALLVRALNEQRSLGKKAAAGEPPLQFYLSVINKNDAARKLYESIGFRVQEGTPSFYTLAICPPIIIGMTLNL